MQLLRNLWQDTSGAVVTAEAVLVGTVGVLAAVTGVNTLSRAVDGELQELSYSIRSLDQSYGYHGHESCVAWTAGSYYRQPDVEQSLAELKAQAEAEAKSIRHGGLTIDESDEPQPKPNQLPDEEAPATQL